MNMYLVALCWIISILFIDLFCHGSYIEAAYSTKFRVVDLEVTFNEFITNRTKAVVLLWSLLAILVSEFR